MLYVLRQPGSSAKYIGYTSRCLVTILWRCKLFHNQVGQAETTQSGAPGWTLELAGFDLSNDGEKLVASGAAYLDGIRGGILEGERGLWPTGYQKLAAATMK
jgi:hypothetical protein